MILSLETATATGSVALHNRGQLLGQLVSEQAFSHAERLAPMISRLLQEQDVAPADLEAVAVSAGPGSYTGLRIGVSTAKGLCYALGIPLIAVNTLESMLPGLPDEYAGCWRCPMIDARRMEVYSLLADDQGRVVEPAGPRIITADSYAGALATHRVVFYGNGAAKCRALITHKNAIFAEGITPLAAHVGLLAWPKHRQQQYADLAYFEPEYLKPWLARATQKPLL